MLSKDSVKLLKWMKKNDEWLYYYDLEDKYLHFEYRDFKALKDGNFIDTYIDDTDVMDCTEYDDSYISVQYQINSNGKAYLEFQVSNRWKEFRNWLTLIIAVAAFLKSFFLLG